jgi:hypothetical protein
VTKALYKLLSLATSVVGGIVAGAIFKRLWKVTAGEDEAPTATAVVQATIERGTAEGTRKLTGVWPGDQHVATWPPGS